MEGQVVQLREVLKATRQAPAQMTQAREPDVAGSGVTSASLSGASEATEASTLTSSQGAPARPLGQEKFRKHVIRSNDNFYKLAQHYGVDLKAMEQANPELNSTKLQIGQVINVPYPTTTASR